MKTAAPWQIIMALCLLLLVPSTALSDNVALNKTVTLQGTFGNPIASPATLVDGVFRPEQTQWNDGSVWWAGHNYPNNYISIDLGGLFTITSFKVQADDNDMYRISYWDAGTSSWTTAYDVPYQFSGGLVTRPEYFLATPITTSLLKFEAIFGSDPRGDTWFAVSEIQALNTQVPLPPTVLLLGSGLLGLAGWRKLRKS